MAKFAPRIPIASAAIFEPVTIDAEGWRRIEQAYGRNLSLRVRGQLHEATEEYVRFGALELHAAQVSQAEKRIATLQEAAGKFAEMLNADKAEDASFHAMRLIDKQFEPASAGGERRTRMSECLLATLWCLHEACAKALKDLKDPKNHGHRPGMRWARWIQELTLIVCEHSLPHEARKDTDKQKTDRPSPFVALLRELQSFIPKPLRRASISAGALATAISEARKSVREE
jgi:hypothetical protein